MNDHSWIIALQAHLDMHRGGNLLWDAKQISKKSKCTHGAQTKVLCDPFVCVCVEFTVAERLLIVTAVFSSMYCDDEGSCASALLHHTKPSFPSFLFFAVLYFTVGRFL